MTIELEEGQRQAILLALAKLSLSRPGWHPAFLTPIAELLGGKAMYEEFRSHGPDDSMNQEMRAELRRYRIAIDAIYNHNEAARAAVLQHFGIGHPPIALTT